MAKYLIAGENLLAIRAQNHGGVAGAIARLHVVTTDKKDLVVGTDDQTRVTQTANPDWLKSDFDDRAWPKAVVLGDATLAPWSIAERDPKAEARRVFVQTLWQWQHDSDLAGIRDKAAVAKLSAEEQKAVTDFWADIVKAVEPSDNAERLRFAGLAHDLKKFAFA